MGSERSGPASICRFYEEQADVAKRRHPARCRNEARSEIAISLVESIRPELERRRGVR